MDILPRQKSKYTLLWICGACASLVLCVLPFLHSDPLRENYTGVLNRRPLYTAVCLIPVLVFMTAAFLHTAMRHWPKQIILRETVLMSAMAVLLMCIPYRETEDFWSGFHVLFGFAAFVNLNRLCLNLFLFYPASRTVWIGGMVLSFLTALTALSINGISEIFCAATVIGSLTLACIRKKEPSV